MAAFSALAQLCQRYLIYYWSANWWFIAGSQVLDGLVHKDRIGNTIMILMMLLASTALFINNVGSPSFLHAARPIPAHAYLNLTLPFHSSVTLYNCSAFSAPVCTSCLAVNIGTGYDCGWCNGISRCVAPETCSSAFTIQPNQCPSPVLSYVSPSSGPFGGGTRLTITGTNLGVTVGDIVSVTVGGVSCTVQSDGYIPRSQVVCVNGAYISGGMQQQASVNVIITINESGTMATAQYNLQYTYVRLSILSVFPKSGPISGGTNVVIGGMFLNVGNGVKGVLLNGAMCVIL